MAKSKSEVPVLMYTKADLALILKCSLRNVENLQKAGRLPAPFYIGKSSPRWFTRDVHEWIGRLSAEANPVVE